MIRISEICESPKHALLVEGTLSSDWVEVLEECWLEAQASRNGEPLCVDLSGVTWIDDRGRELLARMVRDGAELRATGVMVMTRMVIEQIIAGEASPQTQPETHVEKQAEVKRKRGKKPQNTAIPTKIEKEPPWLTSLRRQGK